MTHSFLRITGLCNPRASTIKIECKCGSVCEGKTFAAAARAFEEHKK